MEIKKIVLGFCVVFIISCDFGLEVDRSVHVYKTKGDYSLYVPIELSSDKSRITSAPGRCGPPQNLVNGYFLGNTMGVNTAYLSLTIEEYNSYEPLLGVDSLYKYIMEDDPFLEYYRGDIGSVSNDHGIDTTFINTLILEDRLTEYFEKVK